MSEERVNYLLEAEARVAQLVRELERVKRVSDQLDGAKARLDASTSRLIEVGESIDGMARAVNDVVEKLRRLEPEAIMKRLEFLSKTTESLQRSGADAASDRLRIWRLAQVTLAIVILSLVVTAVGLVLPLVR